MEKVSFVIPCYCSKETIADVVLSIEKIMTTTKEFTYEVILVNDCSPDSTYETIKKVCAQHPNVCGINLAKNFGQHNAIMAGLRETSGDYIVCLDDDGQTDPGEFPKFFKKLQEGYDVVYAKYPEKKHSFFRNLGSQINEVMAKWMLGKPRHLRLSSYFIMRRFVAEQMVAYEFPFPYLAGMILRITNNIANVEIEHHDRASGESNYTFRSLIKLWINGFTNFSILPLRLFGFIGLIFALIGFTGSLYLVIRRLIHPEIPMGWTSTMVLILAVGGLIILICSLIGEYVGRIFISLNRIPQYVIKEKIDFDQQEDNEEHSL